MLRVMLVDDESLARQGLRAALEDVPGVEVCGEADSMARALALLPDLQPDALFLDVRLPHGDGFALLKRLPTSIPVVFVTAHNEYAVQAFEVDAVDYLLKPVRPGRLAQAVDRLRAATGLGGDEPAYDLADRICLRTPERTLIAALEDVIVLQADGDFTRVTAAGESPLLICQTLRSYEQVLPDPPFVRLDRSLLVNLERVESIEVSPTRGARIFLSGLDKPVEIGRTALRRLREALPQATRDLAD